MGAVDRVIFNGVIFRRYPDSDNWPDRSYFTPGIADRQRGVGRLHQEIWKAVHGPIPEGYHIHHKDENTLNNSPDNLACISAAEHNAEHAAPGVFPPWLEAVHLLALERAAEWHRSEEGRAWHREHGRRCWEGREYSSFTCEQCGAEYKSRAGQGQNRFCSNSCKSQWRRVSGVDNEDRTCGYCGQVFRINKYAKARTCSRVCGQGLRRQRAAS
ncbi:HNH endonuclease signature motif containing protein [Streptomyces sp. VTCC 41912]|uniref:HNH endonuclease signature motif containing protein n=1 Tax=Streptomyces sp. VTCC 41912 TaxID=3383243 RepID=UPI003896C4F4